MENRCNNVFSDEIQPIIIEYIYAVAMSIMNIEMPTSVFLININGGHELGNSDPYHDCHEY